jgi:hypothetical protein
LRPLGFGSTKSRAPCTVARWNPGLITGASVWPSTRHNARYIVTPTKATISGRNRSIFFSRIFQPSRYSAGTRSSMPGLGLATRLVMPIPHSGSLTSSSCVTGCGTIPAA